MTNEQLAVLLIAWRDRLKVAIEKADVLMPEDAERLPVKVYRGEAKDPFSRSLDVEGWEAEYAGPYIALEPLREMLEAMDEAITNLLE